MICRAHAALSRICRAGASNPVRGTRLLTEAQRNLTTNKRTSRWAETTIASDLALYQQSTHAVDQVSGELASLSSPARAIQPDPSGAVNASINPLAAYREGRPLPSGTTMALESASSATVGSHLALAFNPRLSTVRPRGLASQTTLRLQSGSASLLFGNLSIEGGRDYAIFGQSPTGGLLLSENAPALDMLRFSNDQPTTLPTPLHWLGPARGTLVIADLGPHQQHPHTTLIAYHVAILPLPQLELGLQLIDLMGGSDRPGTSLTAKLVDLLPFIDPILRRRSTFPDSLSNKMAGGDIRWRIPRLAGLELYGEFGLDDFDGRRFRSSFLEDGGFVAGVFASCLTECGRTGVRLEYRQTGIRYYTHSDYGVAKDGLLLGDPLGPRGLGQYLTIDRATNSGAKVTLVTAFEVRSGNTYGSATTGADTKGFHFVQVSHRPGEKRARLLAEWQPRLRVAAVSLRLSAGVERVSNYAFVAGQARVNALADIGLTWRP
ncbi:MAG: capsule assembly Wzi family protein [Gemmatimonadaceae bacterium]